MADIDRELRELAAEFEVPLESNVDESSEDSDPGVDEITTSLDLEFNGSEDEKQPETVRGVELLPGTPPEVVTLLEGMARSDEVIRRTLELADLQMMRRTTTPTAELRHRKWERSLLPANVENTKRWLKKWMKRALAVYHLEQVAYHCPPMAMPRHLIRFRPEHGIFVVDDAAPTRDSVGCPSYMEQTPPMIVRSVYETWSSGRPIVGIEDVDLDTRMGPLAWDLTAGSGTVGDLLEHLLGGLVIGADLCAAYAPVTCEDARNVGRADGHRRQGKSWGKKLERFVPEPDLVFIDPPSRGTPTHVATYDIDRRRLDQDLGLLDRSAWVQTVTEITLQAVSRLAPCGLVSLIVRAGSRSKGAVTPEPETLGEVKAALGQRAQVIEEHPIEFRNRTRQFSLGTNRVPATHLLLARPA